MACPCCALVQLSHHVQCLPGCCESADSVTGSRDTCAHEMLVHDQLTQAELPTKGSGSGHTWHFKQHPQTSPWLGCNSSIFIFPQTLTVWTSVEMLFSPLDGDWGVCAASWLGYCVLQTPCFNTSFVCFVFAFLSYPFNHLPLVCLLSILL